MALYQRKEEVMGSRVKIWKDWPGEDCPKCKSSDAEVLSKTKKANVVYDGEKVRCKNCGHDGEIMVEDSECADIFWYDYEHGSLKEASNG